ncbi:phosphoribosylaminoimidazolesuccinocarboxamide synthase [Arthrobacter sp. HY1533]|uniref:phosphoribosylaminoimidazolesuccinocarboxamide synthase n=1 Tax=Arthrobacter sp. HY1533 TaxID=2970919 RepID=UPI0022BA0F4C|nr:phosphoribosylaminoimidazolesuccinocarboxamide synthase [Arthrobacter sp. HY1533]
MPTSTLHRNPAASLILDQCHDLELDVQLVASTPELVTLSGPSGEPLHVGLDHQRHSFMDQVLQQVHFDFTQLPLLVLGDSKEIRLLTPKIALARLLPTLYSFTNNRYGVVEGTEAIRARFSAEIFRSMAVAPGNFRLSSAFLSLVESPQGPLLAERRVQVCNLETRVKRYHIGSPIHRYLFTEEHPTVAGPALQRWERFAEPVVCFDWRHPLTDREGNRLADEPLPDDYAALWTRDVQLAKRLARDTFAWLEEFFTAGGLKLIDICFFIDQDSGTVYGEISPDCMRVRTHAADDAEALDKDQWRSGGGPDSILERYARLHTMLFGPSLPVNPKQ